MLQRAKQALRISDSTDVFDDEITDLIEAARDDLALAGVVREKADSDTDSLIRRAVITYVKAHFGWDNPDADRLQLSYDSLKRHMLLSFEYAPREVPGYALPGSNLPPEA